ncbi:DUF417 family protein [Dictyobacter formicarum]|uniref:Membrane protein YkgB n=1 Tax=Dictyobacter formicarum TaxID=2778368 RepID=A0ABQ3VQW2_9CHLR|nr:DUF417 family protein [Dictyobacter formicarum]GHO88101.1 hypothetical protein KSZ_61070 [Dictyobacter formicarum]
MTVSTASQSQAQQQSESGIYHLIQVIAPPLLRVTLGIVFLWLGITKFFDPSPVRGALEGSYAFLASDTIVYILGGLEILTALLLFIGIGLRFVGVLILLFFVGTLSIFFIESASMYSDVGFPALNITGEFFIKDVSLAGVALMIIAQDMTRQAMKRGR